MAKIFDALEKAQKEKSGHKSRISKSPRPDIRERLNPIQAEPGAPAAENAENFRREMRKEKAEGKPQGDGAVSGIQQAVDKSLVTLLNPRSFESEQFKKLRTNILFSKKSAPPKSILVTSSVPGEGKTFVASNLAISLAQNINEYVVLLDCDLRHPCIHRIFGYGDVPGLSDYLEGTLPLSSIMLKTRIRKLSIVPGGIPPLNPSELLSSHKMSSLIEEIKVKYPDRYVVIDSPPPQFASETQALAHHIDGVVLIIKYGSTHRELVSQLVQLVGKEKIIGIAMNWFNLRSADGQYGKYSKYNKYYPQN